MRVSLARLLLTRPSLLVLDEPTNHLDIEAIRWLEDFLAAYRSAYIVVIMYVDAPGFRYAITFVWAVLRVSPFRLHCVVV